MWCGYARSRPSEAYDHIRLVSKTRLNERIKGKRSLTSAAALDLADALGTSPKLWMNLQATFDLDKESKARRVA